MTRMKLLVVLLLLTAAVTVTACRGFVRGSGDLISETREVADFDSISLSGSGEVIVTQGDNESLSIETDDNVMEHVKAEVVNGVLELGFEDAISWISPTRLIFTVGVDDLTGLSISGSGDIEAGALDTSLLEAAISGSGDVQITVLTADDVQARISGSGEIQLNGEATSQDIAISGSGSYLAGEMCSATITVNISGSGNATVCAVETLDANISGSGTVNYYGQPAVNLDSSGSGDINSLGEQ